MLVPLLFVVSLEPALAGDLISVRPTPDGTVSINVGDSGQCTVGCGGDWSGSACTGLPGAVVTVYADARKSAPVATSVVNGGGWADIAGLTPGTYRWTVNLPGHVRESGRVDVQERPAAPSCDHSSYLDDEGRLVNVKRCFVAYHRPYTAAERPWGTWLQVLMRPGVFSGSTQRATTFSAETLQRVPL